MSTLTSTPRVRESAPARLAAFRDGLESMTGARVIQYRGWDLDREQRALAVAARTRRRLVSVRLGVTEALIGPLWVPNRQTGCAGCAEARERLVLDHPLQSFDASRTGSASPLHPVLPELLEAALSMFTSTPLQPGELVAVGTAGTRRHRIARSVGCAACAVLEGAAGAPDRLKLLPRPVAAADPSRGQEPSHVLDEATLDDRVVDPRFGPVRRVLRESNAPFAMSMAVLTGATAMGHGRARAFTGTRAVAVLEAYERFAGFPFDIPILTDVPFIDIADVAVDPLRLGRYSAEQLAHPSTRVEPYDPHRPLDWVWGHELSSGRPRLVPADLAFYQYDYHHKRDFRAARAADRSPRRCFLESSSGCAVGSSFEEAAVHALFEVAERDAFQIAWHRRSPLPTVPVHDLEDDAVAAMTELIESRGYDVHVLVATQDIAVPVVWVLARRPDGRFPASFSSAGSGVDPLTAVRSAMREVAQLVTNPVDWTPATVEPMLADPWQVQELADHVRYNSVPETAPRVAAGLGGPVCSMDQAFPGWPHVAVERAAGDVRGVLDLLRERFAAAGCEEIVLVDQSSREHRDRGLSSVRAVVPGTVPMCFGLAHQRLEGIPRLTAALAGTAAEHAAYDPHPFP